MNKSRQWLGWVAMSFVAIASCHALPPYWKDPFLSLSSPTLVSNQVQITLTGEPDVSYVILSSSEGQTWLPITTNNSPEFTRLISVDAPTNEMAFYRAWREPLPMFPGAIVAHSNIVMNGNNITIDSYDSGDPNYSDPSGRYDPLKRKAGGDVFSAEGFTNLGNATIKGLFKTSPSGGYSVGTNGSVGDLAWTGPGVQPGWYLTNFHWALPNVAVPYPTGLPPIGYSTYWWMLGNAEYMYFGDLSASGDKLIYVVGNATVFVTGNFTFPGTITIAPGGSLKLYVGGGSTQLGLVNNPGNAFAFQYYGLPANTNISCTGNDVLTGVFYAPQATLNLTGAIAQFTDIQGACVVNSLNFSGHFRFHFDENLKRRGPVR